MSLYSRWGLTYISRADTHWVNEYSVLTAVGIIAYCRQYHHEGRFSQKISESNDEGGEGKSLKGEGSTEVGDDAARQTQSDAAA